MGLNFSLLIPFMIQIDGRNLKKIWAPSGQTLGDLGWNDPLVNTFLKSQLTQVIEIYQKSTNFQTNKQTNKNNSTRYCSEYETLEVVLANIFITLLAKIISFSIFIFSIVIPFVRIKSTMTLFTVFCSWQNFNQVLAKHHLILLAYLAIVATIHVQEFCKTSCYYPLKFRIFVMIHNHSIHNWYFEIPKDFFPLLDSFSSKLIISEILVALVDPAQ